ncbi:hypothetical protein HK104_011017 [Borealophlyctis nickersoniae]|nr:hypothetical protein HK104_011017 [Borealophlyctis nickersoniae]
MTQPYVISQEGTPKKTIYRKLMDPIFPNPGRKPHYYIETIKDWGKTKYSLIFADPRSENLGFIGQHVDDEWCNWTVDETSGVTLPLDPQDENTWPVGLAFDLSSSEPLPAATPDDPPLPPCPILLILLNTGGLLAYHYIDLDGSEPYKHMSQATDLPQVAGRGKGASMATPAKPTSLTTPTTTPSFTAPSKATTATAAPFATATQPTTVATPTPAAFAALAKPATTAGSFAIPAVPPLKSSSPFSVPSVSKPSTPVPTSAPVSNVPALAPSSLFGAQRPSESGSGSANLKNELPPASSQSLFKAPAPKLEIQKEQPQKEPTKPDVGILIAFQCAFVNLILSCMSKVLRGQFEQDYLDFGTDLMEFEKFLAPALQGIEKVRNTPPSSSLSSLDNYNQVNLSLVDEELSKIIEGCEKMAQNLQVLSENREKLVNDLRRVNHSKNAAADRLAALNQPEQAMKVKLMPLGPESARQKEALQAKVQAVEAQIRTASELLAAVRKDLAKREQLTNKPFTWDQICATTRRNGLAARRLRDTLTMRMNDLWILADQEPALGSASSKSRNTFSFNDEDDWDDGHEENEPVSPEYVAKIEFSRKVAALAMKSGTVPIRRCCGLAPPPPELMKLPLPERQKPKSVSADKRQIPSTTTVPSLMGPFSTVGKKQDAIPTTPTVPSLMGPFSSVGKKRDAIPSTPTVPSRMGPFSSVGKKQDAKSATSASMSKEEAVLEVARPSIAPSMQGSFLQSSGAFLGPEGTKGFAPKPFSGFKIPDAQKPSFGFKIPDAQGLSSGVPSTSSKSKTLPEFSIAAAAKKAPQGTALVFSKPTESQPTLSAGGGSAERQEKQKDTGGASIPSALPEAKTALGKSTGIEKVAAATPRDVLAPQAPTGLVSVKSPHQPSNIVETGAKLSVADEAVNLAKRDGAPEAADQPSNVLATHSRTEKVSVKEEVAALPIGDVASNDADRARNVLVTDAPKEVAVKSKVASLPKGDVAPEVTGRPRDVIATEVPTDDLSVTAKARENEDASEAADKASTVEVSVKDEEATLPKDEGTSAATDQTGAGVTEQEQNDRVEDIGTGISVQPEAANKGGQEGAAGVDKPKAEARGSATEDSVTVVPVTDSTKPTAEKGKQAESLPHASALPPQGSMEETVAAGPKPEVSGPLTEPSSLKSAVPALPSVPRTPPPPSVPRTPPPPETATEMQTSPTSTADVEGAFGSALAGFGSSQPAANTQKVNPMFAAAVSTAPPKTPDTKSSFGVGFGFGTPATPPTASASSGALAFESKAPSSFEAFGNAARPAFNSPSASFGSPTPAATFGAPPAFGAAPAAPAFAQASPFGASSFGSSAAAAPAAPAFAQAGPFGTASFGSSAAAAPAAPAFARASPFGTGSLGSSGAAPAFGSPTPLGAGSSPSLAAFGVTGFGAPSALGVNAPSFASFGKDDKNSGFASFAGSSGGFASYAKSSGGFASYANQQPSQGSAFGSFGGQPSQSSQAQHSGFGAFGQQPSAFGQSQPSSSFGAFGQQGQSAFGQSQGQSAFGQQQQGSAFGQQQGSAFGQQQGSAFGQQQASAFGQPSPFKPGAGGNA